MITDLRIVDVFGTFITFRMSTHLQKSALRGAAQSEFRSLIISNSASALRVIELDQPEPK